MVESAITGVLAIMPKHHSVLHEITMHTYIQVTPLQCAAFQDNDSSGETNLSLQLCPTNTGLPLGSSLHCNCSRDGKNCQQEVF